MGGTYPGAGITLGPIMTFGYISPASRRRPTNASLLERDRRSKVGDPEKTAAYLKTGSRQTWIAAGFMGGAVQ
jgi:hypothetical protein